MSMGLHTEQWYVDGYDGVTGPFTTWDILNKLIAGEMEVTDRVSLQPKNLASWVTVCNEAQFDQAIKDILSTMATAKPGENTQGPGTETGIKSSEELSAFHNLTNIRLGISKQLQQAKKLEEVGSKAASLRQLQALIASKKKIVIEVRKEVKKEVPIADSFQVVKMPSGPKHTFVEGSQRRDNLKKFAAIGASALFAIGITAKAVIDSNLLSNLFSASTDKTEEPLPAKPVSHAALAVPELKTKTTVQNYVSPFAQQFNRAVQYLSSNEYSKAEESLKLAWKIADQKDIGPLLVVTFETAWLMDLRDQKGTGNRSFSRLQAIQRLIQQHEPDIGPFTEEMMVAKIVMASLFRQSDQFATLVSQWIEMDPELIPTKPAMANLDTRRTRWGHLYFWCLDVHKRDIKSAFANAFFAQCVTKAKTAQDALPFVAYAFKVAPQHPQIRGLMADVLYSAGQLENLKKVLAGRSIASAGSSRLTRKSLTALCRQEPNFPSCK